MKQKQWEEAVAEALGWVRYRGLPSVDPSDFDSVRRDDGLSVAAGVARDWYGLPKTMNEWVRRTDGDWAAVAGPVESDPEWLRAGAGEWLGYVLGQKDMPDDLLARLSRLRPNLVAQVPESVWLRKDRFGDSLVSEYLLVGGSVSAVPEPVWPEYVSWVASEDGTQWRKVESLAKLSHERPDLVARVPESAWMREDDSEPLVSLYLRFGGSVSAVPETVWPRYVSWAVGDIGNQRQRADSLARLSLKRPDLVVLVPQSVWLRKERSGESLVSRYLRAGGAATAIPKPVLRVIELRRAQG